MGSPAAFAPPDVRDVTLSLFGGLKTDVAPSDLPEGLSPDTQDGVYLPGVWQPRPCLSKLYATGALTAGRTVLYEKTYIQSNNDPITLSLTSNGIVWIEDVGLNPGNPAQLGNVLAGLYLQSVTAFGREYLATSDLLHGQGIPLQYDGTYLDRVTQDGPGAAVSAQNEIASYTIQASGVPGLEMFPLIIGGIVSISEIGSAVSIVYPAGTAPFLPRVGDPILVNVTAGGGAGYNGTFPLAGVSYSALMNRLTLTYLLPTTGQPPFSGGTIGTVEFPYVLVRATAALPFVLGSLATIAGAGVSGYDGPWTVIALGPTLGFSFNNQDVVVVTNQFGLAASGGGTIAPTGTISPGTHQVVVMFLTRQGALTAPSPATFWVASGTNRVVVTNIPIGGNNVVARVLAFTGAGGDNFFTIPAPATLINPSGPPTIIQAFVIPDATTTFGVFDFSDNALFDGIPIDEIGNDLFDQVVLGTVLGFFSYADRLATWGDWNKIENFRNLGFCGGYLVSTDPSGWTVVTAGGVLVTGAANAPWAAGFSWEITGDGTANPKGQISQPAFQDSFGDPILTASTKYLLRLWALSTAGAFGGAGSVIVDFYSASGGGVLASASLPCNSMPVSTPGEFFLDDFSAQLPSIIPADTVLRVYAINLANGARAFVSEVEIIFVENPYRDTLSRWSYVLNPEAFALSTGNLGPSDDAAPIRCFALLRQSSLLETGEGVHSFQDSPSEPGEWNVNQLTRAVGGVSVRAGDPGKFGTGDAAEDWALVAGKNGVYLFAGSEFWKVSQEISRGALPFAQDPRPTWDDINWAVEQTIVAKNDPSSRRAYFAVPINGSLTPNLVFVLDYREMDTAAQIAGAPPLHITIQGKMKSSDLTRKWSRWNISANDIDILVRPGNQQELCFAGGNGQAIGAGVAYGNIYSLDSSKLTDDDYGAMAPFYTTYAFTDHDQEQALDLGSDMHLFKRVHAFIPGVGQLVVTPIMDSLYNFYPSLSPRVLVRDTDQSNFLKSDLEWTIAGLRGQRCFFRISVTPLPGATDVQCRLQKFIVAMMKDPVAQVRQSLV